MKLSEALYYAHGWASGEHSSVRTTTSGDNMLIDIAERKWQNGDGESVFDLWIRVAMDLMHEADERRAAKETDRCE